MDSRLAHLANRGLLIMMENGSLRQAQARTTQFQRTLLEAIRAGNGPELDRLINTSVAERIPIAVRQADVDQATIAFITNPAVGMQQKHNFVASVGIPIMPLARKPVIEQMILCVFYKLPVAQLVDLFDPIPDPDEIRLMVTLDFMESMLRVGEDSAVTSMLATNRFSRHYYMGLLNRVFQTMFNNRYNVEWDFLPVKTFEFLAMWHVDAIATLPQDFRQNFIYNCTRVAENTKVAREYRVLLPFVIWGADVRVNIPLGSNLTSPEVLKLMSDVKARSVVADAAGELHTATVPNLSDELWTNLVGNIEAYKTATDLFPNWFTENPETIANIIVANRAMSVLTFMGDNYIPGIGSTKRRRGPPGRTLNKFIIDAVLESQSLL